jgi:glycosyltransferase involved in cell wall biosynthesis
MVASICLLSYKRFEYLENTIQQIQKAGCEYELIINDDGSQENSNRQIILDALDSGNASTAIFNPKNYNEGVGRSINKCFKIATGDILIKLDSDIDFVDNWLAKCLDIFKNNPKLGLLGLCHYHHDPVDCSKTLLESYEDHASHTHILGSAFAVRKEVYEEFGIGSYSEAFSEDWELMKKIEKNNRWYNGLPLEPLAENYGMGFGRSTIALKPGVTKSINKETFKVEV